MRLNLFDSFADMIEVIPSKAISRTLEREALMLQDDLYSERPVPINQAISILTFCRFVEAAKKRAPLSFFGPVIPDCHMGFYRKTVERLVAAQELPFEAKEEFNNLVDDARVEADDDTKQRPTEAAIN